MLNRTGFQIECVPGAGLEFSLFQRFLKQWEEVSSLLEKVSRPQDCLFWKLSYDWPDDDEYSDHFPCAYMIGVVSIVDPKTRIERSRSRAQFQFFPWGWQVEGPRDWLRQSSVGSIIKHVIDDLHQNESTRMFGTDGQRF